MKTSLACENSILVFNHMDGAEERDEDGNIIRKAEKGNRGILCAPKIFTNG